MKNVASQRNSVLRTLTSSKSGLQKEGLTCVYKALTRSSLLYASPAWSLQLSKTNWDKLERRQNDVLRSITGCTKMTDIHHLRHETRCIAVEAHCKMTAAQFAAKATEQKHRCQKSLDQRDERHMKMGLKRHLIDYRAKYGIPESCTSEETCRALHTDFVAEQITNYPDNKLIGKKPPVNPATVDALEKNLSRSDRTLLAQLRSSYCPLVRDYQHRIGKTENVSCRKCGVEPETTAHAIRCICKIDPETLWTDPETASQKAQILRA